MQFISQEGQARGANELFSSLRVHVGRMLVLYDRPVSYLMLFLRTGLHHGACWHLQHLFFGGDRLAFVAGFVPLISSAKV